MKIFRFVPFLFLLLMGGLLSGCAGGQVIESWHGVTLSPDGQTAYLAGGPAVYAVNVSNGTEKWRFPDPADNKITFYAPPAVAPDGSLVAGSFNHSLYRFIPGEGSSAPQLSWVFSQAKDRYIAAPVIAGELILAPSGDNTLYAVSMNGELAWKFTAEHGLWGSPLVDKERVYVASLDHHLYALKLDTGELIWKTDDVGGQMTAQPGQGPDGTLYVGVFGSKNDDPKQASKLLAINPETGALAWSLPTKSWVWHAPVLDGNVLYFADQDGYVYAVDAQTQSPIWQVQPETGPNRAIVGGVLVKDDALYFANKAGNFYILNKDNGSQRGMQTIGGQIYASPLLAGDVILLAPLNYEAQLVAVDGNGARRWPFTPAKK